MFENRDVYEIRSTLKVLKELKEKMSEPFIMDACTLSNQYFAVNYRQQYRLKGIIENLLTEWAGETNVWGILDFLCIKDEEWNKWRNRNYKFEAYQKYKMKSEYVQRLNGIVDAWIDEGEKKLDVLNKEKEETKRKLEEERKKYTIKDVYKNISPTGGEKGVDGYFDALIEKQNSQALRVVARNVFDFGYYTYPKRVEGTDEVISRENWTEEEKDACNWLSKFSPFTNRTQM